MKQVSLLIKREQGGKKNGKKKQKRENRKTSTMWTLLLPANLDLLVTNLCAKNTFNIYSKQAIEEKPCQTFENAVTLTLFGSITKSTHFICWS